jgi:hypothetical protein
LGREFVQQFRQFLANLVGRIVVGLICFQRASFLVFLLLGLFFIGFFGRTTALSG